MDMLARPTIPDRDPHVLIFVPHTCDCVARSGIQRVVMRLVEHLPSHLMVDLVKWDRVEGQLRYCDLADFKSLFKSSAWPKSLRIHPKTHLIEHRFDTTVPSGRDICVLMPEIFYLIQNGNEIYARLISQCGIYGWKTAVVFYDLIPITQPGYPTRDDHARYVAEILRTDVAVSISQFVDQAIRRFLHEKLKLDPSALRKASQQFVAIPLADGGRLQERSMSRSSAKDLHRDLILVVGTIEERKQQIRVIQAFKRIALGDRAHLRLVLVGGLNPGVERQFRALIDGDPHISWLGYASDDAVERLYARARFSIFASADEGFGLPIVESLWRGVPCLTTNFGAMLEAAEGGGCLVVDVRDDRALDAGLNAMAFDDALLDKYQEEIERRCWRSWDDYAGDIACVIRELFQPPFEREGSGALRRMIRDNLARPVSSRCQRLLFDPDAPLPGTEPLTIDVVDRDRQDHPAVDDRGVRAVLVTEDIVDAAKLSSQSLASIFSADAWFCASEPVYDGLISRAAAMEFDGLLSGCCGWAAGLDALVDLAAHRCGSLLHRRLRRSVAAQRDTNYQAAWKALGCTSTEPVLCIVISAFNGGDFIERNIEHCLSMIAMFDGRVKLVVCDNASTDDTEERIERFIPHRLFEYVRASHNTGLLGNLHFVSTFVQARHIWIIGVDDLIVPSVFVTIVETLIAHPACPFIMPNFGVYWRENIGADDSASNLIAEGIAVGQACAADGMSTARQAASQHDNLLTAFYIIIFRSDLLAAVFNDPQTGPFFGSLENTVPTTKIIFDHYPDFNAIWLETPAVVGNAHNSWRRHRMVWHGVMMPLTFELARDAGLDPKLLHGWSLGHLDLFAEATRLYPDPDISTAFSADIMEASHRVFRRRLATCVRGNLSQPAEIST